MSLEMAQKVIVPQKKNYVPQFLKQRDINSYYVRQMCDKYVRATGGPHTFHCYFFIFKNLRIMN
jgi:hypothetical protein